MICAINIRPWTCNTIECVEVVTVDCNNEWTDRDTSKRSTITIYLHATLNTRIIRI